MRKGDQQELEKLRSYRANQEFISAEQATKIAALEAALKRVQRDLETAKSQQQNLSKLEQQMEKQKRAFMRHHQKEMKRHTEKCKEVIDEWKKSFRQMEEGGHQWVELYLKKNPSVTIDESSSKRVLMEMVGMIAAHMIEGLQKGKIK